MASTFAKIMAEKAADMTPKPTLMSVAHPDDPRYFVVLEDGKIIACGDINSVMEQLPPEYRLKPVKYWYYDPPRDEVRVIM